MVIIPSHPSPTGNGNGDFLNGLPLVSLTLNSFKTQTFRLISYISKYKQKQIWTEIWTEIWSGKKHTMSVYVLHFFIFMSLRLSKYSFSFSPQQEIRVLCRILCCIFSVFFANFSLWQFQFLLIAFYGGSSGSISKVCAVRVRDLPSLEQLQVCQNHHHCPRQHLHLAKLVFGCFEATSFGQRVT